MSDTPETDAEKYQCPHTLKFIVEASHAEDLERERNALRTIFPAILEALDNGSICDEDCSLEFYKSIPNEVRSAINRYESALIRIRNLCSHDDPDYAIDVINDIAYKELEQYE